MVEIITQDQTSKFSKPFRVDAGTAVIISSFNFSCEKTNEIGEVVRKGDCAVLHKIDLAGEDMGEGDGCVNCGSCLLDGLDVSVASSEPVVVCGEEWTHNANNNLSILTVPGSYMFELCDESAIGSVTMRIEAIPVSQAAMLPRPLIHGEC